MPNARITAIETLIKTEKDGAYSNIAIDNALKNSGLNSLDRAFASALYYGVLERKITVDYILGSLLKNPIEQTDETVLAILRTGIYQLKFMDKVPDNAAVDESVKCCVTLKKYKYKGLVNAVLRSFIRSGKKIIAPKSEFEQLSVKYSVPVWLVKSYIHDYGRENAEKIMRSFLKIKKLTVRVNTRKTSAAQFIENLQSRGIEAKESPVCKNAVRIENSGDVKGLFGFDEGLFHVQDIASQLCALALNCDDNSTVLDVCAAPGGKSFTLAQMTNATVTACDLYPQKVRLIENGAKRLGLSNINAIVNDASAYNDNLGKFDRILCDLPCSGLGILGKKPEIRYKNVTFLDKLPQMQYHLLEQSAKYLKTDGLLVYSTCTLRHNENRDIADKFLSEHNEFEAVPLFPNIKRAIDEPENQLTLMPYMHGCDGFFISLFRKRG